MNSKRDYKDNFQIEKEIFNGEYYTFRNLNKIVNNCGIISKDGKVVFSEKFENVMYSVANWAIVTSRYNVYLNPDDVYYGIIDKDMNIIEDPNQNEFRGYDGYLKIDKILKKLCEELYGIDSVRNNFLIHILAHKK